MGSRNSISVLILFLFIIYLLIPIFQIPISKANPLPTAPETGTGNLLPLNQTSISLKSETICTNISNIIVEHAEYLLKNLDNSSINMTIALPFGEYSPNLPEDLTLKVNGTLTAYSWIIDPYLNISGNRIYCDAIIFNVSFIPFEEKLIIINYSRTLLINKVGASYTYITETACYWNGTIEYARFDYTLDKRLGEIYIFGLDSYSSYSDGDYLVVSKEFVNWTPADDILISFDPGGVPGFAFEFVIYTLITFTLILGYVKRRMKIKAN